MDAQCGKELYRVDQVELVELNKMDIIFGRDFKLEAGDPYFFYAYEFRRYSLLAKLIVAIGYGFLDDHINKMLGQALRDSTERRLLIIAHCSADKIARKQEELASKFDLARERFTVLEGTAKSFLEQSNLAEILSGHMPSAADSPF